MINQEDMMNLAYKCEKQKLLKHTALIFPDSEYPQFLQHYGFYLKLMTYCQSDDEFRKNLQNLMIAKELNT